MRLIATAAALAALAAACAPVVETDMSGTTEAGRINMERSSQAEFTMMGPFPVVEGGFRP